MDTPKYNVATAPKTGTFQLRINPEIKKYVESLYANCGMTLTDAVNAFLQQSINTGGLPFLMTQNSKEIVQEQAILRLILDAVSRQSPTWTDEGCEALSRNTQKEPADAAGWSIPRLKSSRHQQALERAVKALRDSKYASYITALILYGSCARGEERFDSDVDLFLEMKPEFQLLPERAQAVNMLRQGVVSEEIRDPEVELRFAFGSEWRSATDAFHTQVRTEGVWLWD